MPITDIESIESLKLRVGEEIAVSDWLQVTQEMINSFAEVTGDRQWIHTDPERCLRESPFGVPIAHGFLTLSLVSNLSVASLTVRQPYKAVINTGIRKVRFMSPVPAGSHVRLRQATASVFDVRGGWQVNMKHTIEIQESGKTACVLETATRYYI